MAYADYHDMLQMTEDLISGELSSALPLSHCVASFTFYRNGEGDIGDIQD